LSPSSSGKRITRGTKERGGDIKNENEKAATVGNKRDESFDALFMTCCLTGAKSGFTGTINKILHQSS
jgi:hypothetical protein